MNSLRRTCEKHPQLAARQRGAVLFIALIAMVAIMLAAVALMRSVDTNTVIAGNLAFKQAATASANGGLERAIGWMRQVNANAATVSQDPFLDPAHPFNNDNAIAGYYSSMDAALDLTAASTWVDGKSANGGMDGSGNTIRYIIQRMCRVPNQVLSEANCMFSDATTDNDSHNTGQPFPKKGGKHPLNRVTVRVTGPKNTVSYIQAFIY